MSFGTRLVEHLNIATIGGLPVAVAAYFWANRLLPVDLAARGNWEVGVFFAVWGLAALHPLLRGGRRAWLEQLVFGAALFILLPIVDWLTIGQWVLPIFDLVTVGLGASLLLAAAFVGRHRPKLGSKQDAARARAYTTAAKEKWSR